MDEWSNVKPKGIFGGSNYNWRGDEECKKDSRTDLVEPVQYSCTSNNPNLVNCENQILRALADWPIIKPQLVEALNVGKERERENVRTWESTCRRNFGANNIALLVAIGCCMCICRVGLIAEVLMVILLWRMIMKENQSDDTHVESIYPVPFMVIYIYIYICEYDYAYTIFMIVNK